MFNKFLKALSVPTVLLTPSYLWYSNYYKNNNRVALDSEKDKKTFTIDEISKHNTRNDIWITYYDKVYNVTNFINHHPGGADYLMMAAGSSVAPYWNIYKQHDDVEIHKILQKYHIGYIETESMFPIQKESNSQGPYQNEPMDRSSKLIIKKKEPFNAQPSLQDLRKSYITPTPLWFIRHHHPTPDIKLEEYKLTISGKFIEDSVDFNFEQIKQLPSKTIINTIQCAGNRRKEFLEHQETEGKVLGLHWDGGAISTAKFKGVLIRDLLSSINYNMDSLTGEYFQFFAEDEPYDASISSRKAIDKYGDVMIAYEMNDEPIPRDHGGPVRLIVPGYTGAKNVKWLTGINISNEPSYSTWQRGVAYRGYSPNVKSFESLSTDEKNKSFTAEELPVQSFITDYEFIDNELIVKGIAYSGGGRNIVRVDVSIDKANNWHTAELLTGCNQPPYSSWAWTFWEIKIPLSENAMKDKEIQSIICKATDISYNTQPQESRSIWNLRGILNNSWHQVKIVSEQLTKKDKIKQD